ncbi:MAG: hypothetical protein C0434_09305 [Xanthomonadaceae bacterium]|nr:hypothetical protein [Xanthomonadaceae bacterium]
MAISALACGAAPQALAETAPTTRPATEAPSKAKPRKPVRRKAAAPKSRASRLDLTVRDLPEMPRSTPGAPTFVAPIDGAAPAIVDRRGADSGITAAERVAETYRTEPLFQSEQKLQILDAEVPVSVRLGKWKTSEESKALGLSATVPLTGTK